MSARRGHAGRRVLAFVLASGFGVAGTAIAGPPSGLSAGQAVPDGRVASGARVGGLAETPLHRSDAARQVLDLRRRGPDQVRILRRRSGDEVYRVGTPAPPRHGPKGTPWPPPAAETAARSAPDPGGNLGGQAGSGQLRLACRLDPRTVCLAPGAGTLVLWCARRHLVFENRTHGSGRSAACPESAIAAVWLRDPGARASSRIEPGPCPPLSACSDYQPATAP